MRSPVTNFGGNVRFTPAEVFAPRDEQELLAWMNAQRGRSIRVVGSKHAWSDGIATPDLLVDLRHFQSVETSLDDAGDTWANIGAGCPIQTVLRELYARANVTLPALGLITEQTIAGATATGTHGSGKHSLSHYLAEVRVATYDPRSGEAIIRVIDAGDELRAARTSLGCLGIVVSVRLRCVAPYQVTEVVQRCASVGEALRMEDETPLQQFYLLPHLWQVLVQRRVVAADNSRRSWHAGLYRMYWFCLLDVGMHLAIKLLAAWLRWRSGVKFFFRWVMPSLAITGWRVTDRSDKMLIMEHELFKHLELELFVRRADVEATAALVREIVDVFAGNASDVSAETASKLRELGLYDALQAGRGTFVQHYVICVRKVLPDDTLISMSSDNRDAWYAFSFITYVEPREPFFAMANLLARSTLGMFGARLHWGKWFPLTHQEIAATYPQLETFRQIANEFDALGVFRNEYTERALGLGRSRNAEVGNRNEDV